MNAGLRYSFQYHWLAPLDRVCLPPLQLLTPEVFIRPVLHSSVLFYAVPNGGPAAMVWGVCTCFDNSMRELC